MVAISLKNITKTYAGEKTAAVKDISFEVKEGELFGLIGPDGAGKTTLFRILATLLLADKGRASLAGFDVVEKYKTIRKIVGYMPGKFSLYHDLTVQENLNFFASLFGTTVAANYHLIKDIYEQIKPFKDRRAGKLSGGMKQKLALCCALVHKPQILLLDEPTTGVDAVSRRDFWEMLARLKAQEITILVSTPYMDEASRCDRIALIHQAEVLSIDTPDAITLAFPKKLFAAKSINNYELLKALRALPEVESAFPFGEWVHLTLKDEDSQPVPNIPGIDFHEIKPGIEDSFIRLMSVNN